MWEYDEYHIFQSLNTSFTSVTTCRVPFWKKVKRWDRCTVETCQEHRLTGEELVRAVTKTLATTGSFEVTQQPLQTVSLQSVTGRVVKRNHICSRVYVEKQVHLQRHAVGGLQVLQARNGGINVKKSWTTVWFNVEEKKKPQTGRFIIRQEKWQEVHGGSCKTN